MTAGHPNPVLRYLRRVVAPAGADLEADRLLLERFARQHDEAAFEALLRRHGPLVWGLCRRILSDPHDAEDAFQATFLVFVRKAGAIGRGELLGHWLYGVAYRVAVRARANAAKRRHHERRAEGVAVAEDENAALRELSPILDEEVRRLPAKYRVPFVLCYLQGLTNEAAAREIGCPKGTVLSRLARARERLRGRLARRGVGLSAGALALGVSATASPAAVPCAVVEATLWVGLLVAVGQTTVAGAASASVASLTMGALRAMLTTKLISAALVLMAAGLLGTGAGVVSYRVTAAQSDEPEKGQAPPAAKADAGRSDSVRAASPMEGVLLVIGTEVKKGEDLKPDQIITVQSGGETKSYRRLRKGDRVEAGQLIARLDDRLARDDVAIREAKLVAAEKDYVTAEKIRDEYMVRWDTQKRLLRGGKGGLVATSVEDERLAKFQYEKAFYEAIQKEANITVAKLELNKAQTVREMYAIRCRTAGVIQAILKHPGEAVKQFETVFVIRADEK